VSDCVRCLGVIIDSTLSFNDYVNDVSKTSYQYIRALLHVTKFISDDNAKSIAMSITSGRIDYYNSVLYGTSQSNIAELQRVHNTLAPESELT
jgi:hypothetical protein